MDCPGGHQYSIRVRYHTKASTLVLMDCPGGLNHIHVELGAEQASTLVLMDCPGGREWENNIRSMSVSFNPCFNGLSRRTAGARSKKQGAEASTLVLMDCPGGRAPSARRRAAVSLQPLF